MEKSLKRAVDDFGQNLKQGKHSYLRAFFDRAWVCSWARQQSWSVFRRQALKKKVLYLIGLRVVRTAHRRRLGIENIALVKVVKLGLIRIGLHFVGLFYRRTFIVSGFYIRTLFMAPFFLVKSTTMQHPHIHWTAIDETFLAYIKLTLQSLSCLNDHCWVSQQPVVTNKEKR